MKSDMNKDTRAKKDAQRKTSTLVPSYSITDYSTWSRGYSFHIYSKAKSILSNAYSELGRGDKSSKREKAVKPMTDNISILIMGVDESDIRDKNYGKATRTDALLLATINKTINLLNLLVFHVTHVSTLNHVKYDKITHAHVFGGVDSTIDTVENF